MYLLNTSFKIMKVMCWNVLADSLATTPFEDTVPFPYVDPKYLEWSYRWPLILQEIDQVNPDLLCLMELEHFDQLEASLAPKGYIGYWQPKINAQDGVAIFWRNYDLIESKSIRLSKDRSQVAVAVLLQAENPFLVVATHLKAREEFAEVRCAQTEALLKFTQQYQVPQIICGDFNDLPESQMAECFYQHNFVNAVPLAWTAWQKRADREEQKAIDYIWIHPSIFKIVQTSSKEITGPLPTKEFPSDHVYLVATLQ